MSSIQSRSFFVLLVLATLGVPGFLQAQSWRGVGRLQGVVTAPDGTPLEGASVVLRSARAGDSGPDAIATDRRGKWAALGLIGGTWNIDIEKEGYLPQKGRVELSEVQRAPAIQTTLEPIPPPEPEPEPEQQIVVGGEVISEETAAALEAGNRLMAEGKFREAIAEYEKAQTALPTNLSLKQALARAYYGAGDLAPAIALLEDVHAANPGDQTSAILLANLLLEANRLEDAQAILDGVPEEAIEDPMTIVNIGILFMNKAKPAEAAKYFDRASRMAPDRHEPYYFRGLARIQAGNPAEAKSDLQKVLELAPDSPEAAEAKELLAQIR